MPKLIDLTGKKFNRLLVLHRDEQTEKKGTYWICKCDCGNIKSVKGCKLTSGETKSCGCYNNETIHQKKRNYEDITGLCFGELEVLRYYDSTKDGTRWLCKCHACGNTVVKIASRLKKAKSCGCIMRKAGAENVNTLHNDVKQFKTNIGSLKRTEPNKNNKTTGIKGVSQIKSNGKYVAYITFQGNRYTLKRSYDIDECIKARREAEKNLHKDFLEWYESEIKTKEKLL